MEVIPENSSVDGGEDDDVSLSSDDTEGGQGTQTLVEFASSIFAGPGKRKGSSIGSAKRRPAKAAAQGFLRKRPRGKKLTEKEKKQARDDLNKMPSDRSVDSQQVRKVDDTDEWIDRMKKGLAKDTEEALAGLKTVLN